MTPDRVAHTGHPGIVGVPRWRSARMTLTGKLAVAMILLVAIVVLAVGWLSYHSLEQALLPRVLDRIEAHSQLIASDLQSYVRGARADVATFKSHAAAHGLVLAHFNGGIDPVDHISEAAWRERLTTRLIADLGAKPAYAQFRVIGIEDGQREIIRVDRSGPNGAVRVVPEAELQRKGDRPYFKETIGLAPDEIYVSPIDLNQENGVTVLVTTHLMEEADRCSRLAILGRGHLLACDTPAALKDRIGGDVITIACAKPAEVRTIRVPSPTVSGSVCRSSCRNRPRRCAFSGRRSTSSSKAPRRPAYGFRFRSARRKRNRQ